MKCAAIEIVDAPDRVHSGRIGQVQIEGSPRYRYHASGLIHDTERTGGVLRERQPGVEGPGARTDIIVACAVDSQGHDDIGGKRSPGLVQITGAARIVPKVDHSGDNVKGACGKIVVTDAVGVPAEGDGGGAARDRHHRTGSILLDRAGAAARAEIGLTTGRECAVAGNMEQPDPADRIPDISRGTHSHREARSIA